MSPDEGRYTRERAEVSSQVPPVTEQRRHLYEKRIGVLPVHVPFAAASRPPATGDPATVGGTVLCGPGAWSAVTGRVAADVASAEPSRFVAVSFTRSERPTSAVPGV
jgi:hypothetical protein